MATRSWPRCALDLADQGKLAHRTVVMTVMSNLGFRLAMQDAGISVVETQVGDRYLADRDPERRLFARWDAIRPHHNC